MTTDQNMAGFSCAAHRRYRIGEDQKVLGTAPDIVRNWAELRRQQRSFEEGFGRRIQFASGQAASGTLDGVDLEGGWTIGFVDWVSFTYTACRCPWSFSSASNKSWHRDTSPSYYVVISDRCQFSRYSIKVHRHNATPCYPSSSCPFRDRAGTQ
jgi:hypothetical protein